VRVEDTVVAGKDGPDVLTNYPRSLVLEPSRSTAHRQTESHKPLN